MHTEVYVHEFKQSTCHSLVLSCKNSQMHNRLVVGHRNVTNARAPAAGLYDLPRKIIDDAIQLHGAHGVSQDSHLASMFLGRIQLLFDISLRV